MAILFLLTAITGWAQQEKPLSSEEKLQKSNEYYAAGKQLLQEGNYLAADAEFKKAQMLLATAPLLPLPLTIKPQNPAPLEAKKKAPAPPPPTIAQKAWQSSKEDKPDEAIPLYLKAIELNPKNTNLYYNLGIAYLKTSQFPKAAEAFKKTIQLNPKDSDAYYNLGILYESYLKDNAMALYYYSLYLKYTSEKTKVNEVKSWIQHIKKELTQ